MVTNQIVVIGAKSDATPPVPRNWRAKRLARMRRVTGTMKASRPGLITANPSTADIMWRLVLCGAGFGIFSAPNNRLMMNAVPRERSGSAGGIIATARTLGQTMGAALVALIFGLFDFSGGGAADAAKAALWLSASFAGTALVVGSFRLKLQR